MNVSPIKYNYNCPMTSSNSNKLNDVNKEYLCIGKAKVPYTPATIGIANGVLWFGINMLFDRLFTFITGTKFNPKTSAMFSGVIGVAGGAYAYYKAKKDFAS